MEYEEKIHNLEVQIAKLEINQQTDHKHLIESDKDIDNLSSIAERWLLKYVK